MSIPCVHEFFGQAYQIVRRGLDFEPSLERGETTLESASEYACESASEYACESASECEGKYGRERKLKTTLARMCRRVFWAWTKVVNQSFGISRAYGRTQVWALRELMGVRK